MNSSTIGAAQPIGSRPPRDLARPASHGTMRAAVFAGPREIRLEEIPIPDPGRGQVRVRLEGCGVCASNLPVWEGRPWFTYPREPGDPGHEGWGVIDQLGPDVSSVQVGQRVSLLSYHAYAEYDVADATMVVKLPHQLARIPVPGEPLGCAANILRRSEILPGQTVAIVGMGFLGAILVQMSARAGAQVVAISRRRSALELACRFGAQETIAFESRQQVVAAGEALTGGAGFERVIEVTGKQEPLDLAADLTCTRGRLVIAGYHQDGLRQVNLQQWNWRGLDVINAHERDPRIYVRGMQRAIEELAEGRLDPGPMYTHVYPLAELPQAMIAASERPEGFLKALVMMPKPGH